MPITSEGADLEIVRKVQDIIEQYEAAAARLRQLSNKPQVDGITGYHEFPSLAEDYESRAQKYREVAKLLREPLKAPLSPMQEDALLRLCLQRSSEPVAAVTSRAAEGLQVAADDRLGYLNIFSARGDGNLNDPIFKSSNAEGKDVEVSSWSVHYRDEPRNCKLMQGCMCFGHIRHCLT